MQSSTLLPGRNLPTLGDIVQVLIYASSLQRPAYAAHCMCDTRRSGGRSAAVAQQDESVCGRSPGGSLRALGSSMSSSSTPIRSIAVSRGTARCRILPHQASRPIAQGPILGTCDMRRSGTRCRLRRYSFTCSLVCRRGRGRRGPNVRDSFIRHVLRFARPDGVVIDMPVPTAPGVDPFCRPGREHRSPCAPRSISVGWTDRYGANGVLWPMGRRLDHIIPSGCA